MGGQSNTKKQGIGAKLIKRLSIFSVSCLLLAETSFVIAVFRKHLWHVELTMLLQKSWASFTASISSNTLGFIMSTLILPVLAFAATFVGSIIVEDKGELRKAFIKSLIAGLFAGVAMTCLWGTLFAWSLIKTVYDNHGSLLRSANTLQKQNDALNIKIGDLSAKLNSLPSPQDYERLKTQFSSYKQTIEAAQTRKEFSVYPISHDMRPGIPKMEYLLTTNTYRSPTEINATCDFPIGEVTEFFLTTSGGSTLSTQNRKISENQYVIYILFPAWSPASPLWATVFFKGSVDRMPTCRFELK